MWFKILNNKNMRKQIKQNVIKINVKTPKITLVAHPKPIIRKQVTRVKFEFPFFIVL